MNQVVSSTSATGGLSINGLRLEVQVNGHDIVDEVQLNVPPGTVLALVGESGSGKTTVGLAILGHARRGVHIASGRIICGETDVLSLSETDLRSIRGGQVSYVPQDPGSALNPALRIGVQLREVLEVHRFGSSDIERGERVVEMMQEVMLPADAGFLQRYPHQLSGGQQQRVVLAMSFACRPSVIVLDEPTTGLDVSTQSHILETIRSLTKLHNAAALYITHDLAVVASLADDVAVMYAGRVVEKGPTEDIFASPSHPYTRHLVAAAPDIASAQEIVGLPGRAPAPGKRPVGCSFAARCELATATCEASFPPVSFVKAKHEVRCIRSAELIGRLVATDRQTVKATNASSIVSVSHLNVSYNAKRVVHDVSFDLVPGQCLALLGESGSGKTTVSRSIGGLHHEWTGDVSLHGQALARSSRGRTMEQRMNIQYVFQNPYMSLNPRRTIGESILRPLLVAGRSRTQAEPLMREMLERVALTAAYANSYPNQLSGGERQRVAIARALVSEPDVLICDEVTSALDVLVQAAIVDLLGDLRRDLGLSMLFVTHNLPLVRSIADVVAVMHNGTLVEIGGAETLLSSPQTEYTSRLLADTPSIERTRL